MGGALPGTTSLAFGGDGEDPYRLDGVTAGTRRVSEYTWDEREGPYNDRMALPTFWREPPTGQLREPFSADQPADRGVPPIEHDTTGEWIAPVATGATGAVGGVAALEAYAEKEQRLEATQAESEVPQVPEKSEQWISPAASEQMAAIDARPTASVAEADEAVAKPTHPWVAAMQAPLPEETTVLNHSVTNSAHPWLATMQAPPPEKPTVPESESADVPDEPSSTIVRQDTNMSISQLHVPGEFPKRQ